MQFGTNHLGHFAFTGLLLDRLLPVAGSRVVTISSIGHRIRADIHFDDLQWEHSYNRVSAYGQAKLANLLFTYELQRRLAPHGTTIAVAAHPGGSNTELMRHLPAMGCLRLPGDRTDTPGRVYGRTAAICGQRPTRRCSVGSTTDPTASARPGATPRSSDPARSRTMSTGSAGCGRCPRSSAA